MSGEKGMMLCERPGPGLDSGPGMRPFLPSSSPSGMEPLGLVPAQKIFPPSMATKPEDIVARNRALLEKQQEENRQAAEREEARRTAAAAKSEHVTAFNAELRKAILNGEDVSFWRATKRKDGLRQSAETANISSPPPGEGHAEATVDRVAMVSFVDELVREAAGTLDGTSMSTAAQQQRADGTAEASTSSGGGAAALQRPRTSGSVAGSAAGSSRKGRGGGAKPAWALSTEEASKIQDDEEEELLRFADELDFDSFLAALDDVEVQEAVGKVLQGEGGQGPAPGEDKAWKRQLVAAMNHAAMKRVAATRKPAAAAAGDNDGASVAVGSEGGATALSRAAAASRVRAEQAARGDLAWDATSRASEDVARMERAKLASQEAADFLRENPEMRAVHSPASVRAMISKTETAGAPGVTAS